MRFILYKFKLTSYNIPWTNAHYYFNRSKFTNTYEHHTFFVSSQSIISLFHLRSYLGIWVGAFLRTHSNESMDYHCKSLYMYPRSILLDQSQPREDVLCLFYHYSTGKFKTDSCDNKKSFLCKKQTNGMNVFVLSFLLTNGVV